MKNYWQTKNCSFDKNYSPTLTGKIKLLRGGSWLWYVSIQSSNVTTFSGSNSVFPKNQAKKKDCSFSVVVYLKAAFHSYLCERNCSYKCQWCTS